MKDTILNVLLIFLSKKTRIKLIRKLDLLESLSGKRCQYCREFLYDISFGRRLCCKCGIEWTKSWIEYNLNRQKLEKAREKASLKNKFSVKPIEDIARGIDE